MSSYRFYCHDRLGRLVDRREQHCRDDAAAIGVAHGLNQSYDIEVWLGPRRVARIPKRTSTKDAANDPVDENVAGPALDNVRLG